ncbi:hypothetical protein AAC387_Pa05g2193 [Persea americana]
MMSLEGYFIFESLEDEKNLLLLKCGHRYQSPFHEGYFYKCIYDYWCAAPALQHMGIRSIPEEPQGRQKSGRGASSHNQPPIKCDVFIKPSGQQLEI